MKILKYIIFLSILTGIFFLIYRQSDQKGLRKLWISFKIAVLVAAIVAGLIPVNPEPLGNNNNNQVYHERLLKNKVQVELVTNIPRGGINHAWSPGGKFAGESGGSSTSSNPNHSAETSGGSSTSSNPNHSAETSGGSSTSSDPNSSQRVNKSSKSSSIFAEGFSPSRYLSRRNRPDFHNPGCAGGPKSITVRTIQTPKASDLTETSLKSQKDNVVGEMTDSQGFKRKITERSSSHLLSKHGHDFGVDDPLPPDSNQPLTNSTYTKVRTRVNKENRQKFVGVVTKIVEDPETTLHPNITIRGIKGYGYQTYNYGPDPEIGAFVGVHEEGPLADHVVKVQPLSPIQLDILLEFKAID